MGHENPFDLRRRTDPKDAAAMEKAIIATTIVGMTGRVSLDAGGNWAAETFNSGFHVIYSYLGHSGTRFLMRFNVF